MFRTLGTAARRFPRLASSRGVVRRNFALVNDISVRKRLTIGLSGFAIVATGCYFTGRTIYRSRRAKKMARLEAAKNKAAPAVESVVPTVQESVEIMKEEVAEAPVQEVPESVKEEASESSPEIATPVQEEVSEGVKEESEVAEASEPAKEGAEPVVESSEPVEPVEPVEPAEPEEPVVPVKEEEEEEEEEESEVPVVTEVDDDSWHPWWEGVKEICLYLSGEESDRLDESFPALHNYKPQRRVLLSYNPKPEDANEFGPAMGDDVSIKIIAEVRDEHAQVLVVDIGNTLTSYRYPHIVVSCDDEAENSAYSRVYGRILIDRCVEDGLLVEDANGVFVPKADVENVEVEGYYSYPTTHVTISDLRSRGLEVKSKLCTQRGLEAAPFGCAEAKHDAECSWCVFMKSGPCYRPFEGWQKCVMQFNEAAMKPKEGEQLTEEQRDAQINAYVTSCGAVTLALKRCVDAHPEYYGKLSQPKEEQPKAEEVKVEEVKVEEVKAEEVKAEEPQTEETKTVVV